MKIAAMLALCQYSVGATFKVLLCKVMDMEPGEVLRVTLEETDIKRIKIGEKVILLLQKLDERNLNTVR